MEKMGIQEGSFKQDKRQKRSTNNNFVMLEGFDKEELDKERYREKMYNKFLNDPFNMEKNIMKLVRKSKTGKPKHVAKAKKIIDAMTAINNDSQRLLRYDVAQLYWRILIENY